MATRYQEYPFVGFSFSVKFIWPNLSVYESNFQEVGGLNVKLGIEEVSEGGENRFIHRLPSPPKFENLVLKRGMFKYSDTALIQWAQSGFSSFIFKPKNLIVSLLDENALPVAVWNVKNAIPVGLKVSDFKAQENAIVVETLELSFDYFERTN